MANSFGVPYYTLPSFVPIFLYFYPSYVYYKDYYAFMRDHFHLSPLFFMSMMPTAGIVAHIWRAAGHQRKTGRGMRLRGEEEKRGVAKGDGMIRKSI